MTQVLDSITGGDTVALVGSFGLTTTQNYSFGSTVFIDASAATFSDTWVIRNVDHLSVTGGNFVFTVPDASYTKAVEIYDGSHISFDHSTFSSNGTLGGIDVAGTQGVSVSNSTFTNVSNGVGLSAVTGGRVFNNLVTGTTQDGIDLRASHDIVASHNSCIGSAPSAGAHPDCIQIYSVEGLPISSNIEISDNLAYGDTQGFTKFSGGGYGTNISIIRNLVETRLSQGVACYDCYNSNISDNMIVTLAGSEFPTALNVVDGGDNIVAGNILEDLGQVSPARRAWGSIWYNAGVLDPGAEAEAAGVPEPSIWLSLLAGFGALGLALRRRRQGGAGTMVAC